MFSIPVVIAGAAAGAAVLLWVFLAMCFRIVVSTNDVHIVQSAKKTVSYGKDQEAGNVYWRWPSWIPVIGVKTINLPVSVFDVALKAFKGYDKGRVPFELDVLGFFRIDLPNVAAQRVHSFDEVRAQLQGILQGAIRSILAKAEIEEILEERALFGEKFTLAVDEDLENWGIKSVKNLELMDIRDADDSNAIENKMAVKKSLIERDSRIAVADNMRAAKEAEINASRDVALRDQEAKQQIGQRTAEQEKQVGIAREQSTQEVLVQSRETATRDMNVKQVQEVRKAEIAREVAVVRADQDKKVAVVKAEQDKEVLIVEAEGTKQSTVTVAEGNLTQAQMNAQGIQAEGLAKGKALEAELMAPVTTQSELARVIGENKDYQAYLIEIRRVEATEVVGKEQAKAMQAAEIKIIANTGDGLPSGVSKAMDLFSAKGGTTLGAMVEAFKQTDAGAAIVDRMTGNGHDARR